MGWNGLYDVLQAGGRPASNQLPYNLLWRAIEFDIVPLCLKHNVAILTYSSLQQGLLTGRFKDPAAVPEGLEEGVIEKFIATKLCMVVWWGRNGLYAMPGGRNY